MPRTIIWRGIRIFSLTRIPIRSSAHSLALSQLTYHAATIYLRQGGCDVCEAHLPLEELKRLDRAEKDAERSKRMRMVILASEGWAAPAVAMAVGLSRRICQRWVARYNERGLTCLDDRRGGNSELPLTEKQVAAFRERMEPGPTQTDSVCSLRGKDFQRILADELRMLRSQSSVYWLLHRLGYSEIVGFTSLVIVDTETDGMD